MSGYCTIADVCSSFPQFVRQQTGSISDTQIQEWIDDRKARIRSALLTRGFDPDVATVPVIDPDATRFLLSLNKDGAIADLGDALQGTMTLQPGEYSLPAERRKSYERVMKELVQGFHDNLFQPVISRTADVTPLLRGVGGAETDTVRQVRRAGNNRFFSKNDIF